MPRPRTLPDDEILVRDKDFLGLSLNEIADKYGVSKQAVSALFIEMGRPWGAVAPVNYRDYLPWEIGRDHQALDAAQRLRAHIRWRTGHPSTDAQLRRLSNWHARITRENVTVVYDPVLPSPWIYVPRTASDGELIIRWPADIEPPTDVQRAVLLLPRGPELGERHVRETLSS